MGGGGSSGGSSKEQKAKPQKGAARDIVQGGSSNKYNHPDTVTINGEVFQRQLSGQGDQYRSASGKVYEHHGDPKVAAKKGEWEAIGGGAVPISGSQVSIGGAVAPTPAPQQAPVTVQPPPPWGTNPTQAYQQAQQGASGQMEAKTPFIPPGTPLTPQHVQYGSPGIQQTYVDQAQLQTQLAAQQQAYQQQLAQQLAGMQQQYQGQLGVLSTQYQQQQQYSEAMRQQLLSQMAAQETQYQQQQWALQQALAEQQRQMLAQQQEAQKAMLSLESRQGKETQKEASLATLLGNTQLANFRYNTMAGLRGAPSMNPAITRGDMTGGLLTR